MDFYTNSTFQVQTLRGLGSRDPISKFFGPLITCKQWTQLTICKM